MKSLVFSLGVLFLVACSGEDRAERVYGPNAYAIHGDTLPWANERFDNQAAWDHQMDKRARLQNEYTRIR